MLVGMFDNNRHTDLLFITSTKLYLNERNIMNIKAFWERYFVLCVAVFLYLLGMGLMFWSALRRFIYEHNAVFLYIWLVAFVLGGFAIWQFVKLFHKGK